MVKDSRFVVDLNVGRLAKWLRVMGYDTLFPREGGDNQLVRIALREGRILVTRDAGITCRRAVRLGQMQVVHILDHDLRGQLRQLVRERRLSMTGLFSRCVRCNDLLHPLPRSEAADRVPPYVLESQSTFMECLRCLRIYWQGTHWDNMKAELCRAQQDTP